MPLAFKTLLIDDGGALLKAPSISKKIPRAYSLLTNALSILLNYAVLYQ